MPQSLRETLGSFLRERRRRAKLRLIGELGALGEDVGNGIFLWQQDLRRPGGLTGHDLAVGLDAPALPRKERGPFDPMAAGAAVGGRGHGEPGAGEGGVPSGRTGHTGVMGRLQQISLSRELRTNLRMIQEVLGFPGDLVVREFTIGTGGELPAACVYIDGLVDVKAVNDFILKPLMLESRIAEPAGMEDGENAFDMIRNRALPGSNVREARDLSRLIGSVLGGDTAVLIDGAPAAMLVSTKGFEHRSVDEPQSESVVRGPRDGFIETLRTNTALLRRRIGSPALRIDQMIVGELTRTDIAIAYMDGVANDELVREVKRRLMRIKIDGVLESGYIEDFIEDNPYSPFPQVQRTERPDKVAANLLEGRVGILVDGTPFALIVPAVFVQLMQATEDYYDRPHVAFLLRGVRYLALLLALALPSFYIAVTTFHQEMIPTTLALSIAAGREGIPFPAFVEALIMEVVFEILREAGIRLPRVVGPAISIVGAVVLGEAAVRANIVSSIMVIIVSTTAIASFVVPAFNAAITVRLLRFPIMVLAASLGFFGIVWGLVAILIHMVSLRSFGTPYLYPLAPAASRGAMDVILRLPWWAMRARPRFMGVENLRRQRHITQPQPVDRQTAPD